MKKTMKWLMLLVCVSMLLTAGGCKAKTKGTKLPKFSWDGITLSEYVTLGNYKGVSYTDVKVEVSDEDVEKAITELRESTADYKEILEGTVKDGDTINIDFVGKINGKEFTGGSAKDQLITIGKTSMIDGFIEGLIGKKVGETVVLDLKFPKDYHSADVAGKDVEFTITINYLAGEKILPEFTDEWVKEVTYGSHKTTKELTDYIRKTMTEEKEAEAEAKEQEEVWNKILADSKITFPKKAVEYYVADQKIQVEALAAYYGLDYKTFLTMTGYTEESMNKELQETGETYAKTVILSRAIMQAEGIEITEAEFTKYVVDLCDRYGYKEKDTFLKDYGGEQAVWDDLMMNRALELVMKEAVAK